MSEIADLRADAPAIDTPAAEPMPLAVRVTTILTVLLPLGGLVAAPFIVWGWGFGWTDLGLLVGMYLLTLLGVTVGFHRLFVHRSFETFGWLKSLWAASGSMAVQGSLFQWVGLHRRHHQYSDREQDPHSPHQGGRGVLGVLAGFWHAHIGWFFRPNPADLPRYHKDLSASPSLRVADALFPLWVALGLVLPAVLGGVITQSWIGAATGLLWGGLVRIFLVHHVSWSVNSVCHLWGSRPYKSEDESRNNAILGILALGEGWHNSHHAFPTSARHGLRWWQIDLSYYVIVLMSWLGLAWDVKVPTPEAQEKKLRTA